MQSTTRIAALLLVVSNSGPAIVRGAEATPIAFHHAVIDTHPPNNPWFKMVGDIDGDGDPDVVVAGAKGPLVWYANPSWRKTQIAGGDWDGVNGETADIDADGDTDIVMGGIVWFENPAPRQGPWPSHRIASQRAHDIEIADLDGDGRLDVVARDQSAFGKRGNKVYVCFQRGKDDWSRLVIDSPHGEGLKLGDIDNDGDADIVLAGQWHENPGDTKSRWPKHPYARGWTEPDAKVELADFNRDGRTDIVLSPAELKGETYRVSWFAAPADPRSEQWKENVVIPAIECVIHSLGIGDFDGDGGLDIAIAEMHQGQDPDEVMVLYNEQQGSSWRKHVLSNSGSHDIVVSDMDGDGDPDILGANHGGVHPLELWRNERVSESSASRASDTSGASNEVRRTRIAIVDGHWQINRQLTYRDAPAEGLLVNVRMVNAVLEIANELAHAGYDHKVLKTAEGQAELIGLAKQTVPELLVSSSGMGSGRVPDEVAQAGDFVLIHFNGTSLQDVPDRIADLKRYGKPIVCNEDNKVGAEGAQAARLCVASDASWGFMHSELNQYFPLQFRGARDDPAVYATLKHLTTADDYFPDPESQGGWRKLDQPDDIRRLAGIDPDKLAELKQWLLKSDERDFAAVVIRNGYIVLEVERGNSAKTDARRVASVSKAVCATVLAIASEKSQQSGTPHKMSFDDPAFDFIPWAQPLSDPRKAKITVKQLLNHSSGICPEATGAPNRGTWEYVLGKSGDERTATLAFDPGTGCGYSTHALCHAALVCETVTGRPYDEFAIESLFKPIGCEHWWFQYYDGGEKIGRHPSHAMGMPARDLARIAWCMMHEGRWGDRQIIPSWFVHETGSPTHEVRTPELRWKLNPQVFSHGWELPARHWPKDGRNLVGIPSDARYKPGSGGQLIAFVPSLNLVITRQTGSSGQWEYEEYLRQACAAVLLTD